MVEKDYDASLQSDVPVVIQIWEWDSLVTGDDDACDADPGVGRAVEFTVHLRPCTLYGDTTGTCRQITTTGDADESVELKFSVKVEGPGLEVRCLHTPLWPQPGDTVTITAEAFDREIQVGDTVLDTSDGTSNNLPLVDRSKFADRLEIWTADSAGARTLAASGDNRVSLTKTLTSVAAGDLDYSCNAKDRADTAFTGWRKARVGAPAEGSAIPVLYTGDRKNRIDIVLIPDSASYGGPRDRDFLRDAALALRGAFFGQNYFLENQQWFNFWFAASTGTARPYRPGACNLTAPSKWAADYSWKDAGAILHTRIFRDCARNGLFTIEPWSLRKILHESGHSPFGLADEYGGDGGYFENQPYPNLYQRRATCDSDAPNLGRTPADCRAITNTVATPTVDWYLSEPTVNDLMLEGRPPNAADLRRMDWLLGNCKSGKC